MAQTTERFSEVLLRSFGDPVREAVGCQFTIPFLRNERRAWRDAVAWLEAREAARAEWPWPER